MPGISSKGMLRETNSSKEYPPRKQTGKDWFELKFCDLLRRF